MHIGDGIGYDTEIFTWGCNLYQTENWTQCTEQQTHTPYQPSVLFQTSTGFSAQWLSAQCRCLNP